MKGIILSSILHLQDVSLLFDTEYNMDFSLEVKAKEWKPGDMGSSPDSLTDRSIFSRLAIEFESFSFGVSMPQCGSTLPSSLSFGNVDFTVCP